MYIYARQLRGLSHRRRAQMSENPMSLVHKLCLNCVSTQCRPGQLRDALVPRLFRHEVNPEILVYESNSGNSLVKISAFIQDNPHQKCVASKMKTRIQTACVSLGHH